MQQLTPASFSLVGYWIGLMFVALTIYHARYPRA
jgi:hypothetical protein